MTSLDARPREGGSDGDGAAKIVYLLYFGGILFGLLAIAGVVVAYVCCGDAEGWAASHYRFQIRSFWIGLLYCVVGVATSAFVVGWLILVAALVWWLVRCARGLRHLLRAEPCPYVESWLW